jgi:trans-aconitate methyltransferase
MGCHSGFFSFDVASRGVQRVTGVELRDENIRQARFLQAHYQLPAIEFIQSDIMSWQPSGPFTAVMNLGLLYHVIDPITLVRKTYDWCTDFAVIDTVCHKEPVSAYIAAFNKDIARSGEGKYTAELHPTYRALIDTMHDAGFTDLIELIAGSGRIAGIYEKRTRRCIVGFKRPINEVLRDSGLT